MNKLEDSVIFSSSSDVIDICSPLFSTTEIDYYDYSRYYKDGYCLLLSSHPQLFSRVVQASVYPTFYDLSVNQSRYVVLSHEIDLPQAAVSTVQLSRYQAQINEGVDCDIYHRFYILQEHRDYWEISAVGTTKKNSKVLDFYFNNILNLEKFILYFRDKASRLIAKVEKDKVFLDRFLEKSKDLAQKYSLNQTDQIKLLIQAMLENKYCIAGYRGDVTLSKQESKCLFQMGMGRTIKETSAKLGISPKTIDTHLVHIKEKLGCHNKNQMLEVFMSSDLKTLSDKILYYLD